MGYLYDSKVPLYKPKLELQWFVIEKRGQPHCSKGMAVSIWEHMSYLVEGGAAWF